MGFSLTGAIGGFLSGGPAGAIAGSGILGGGGSAFISSIASRLPGVGTGGFGSGPSIIPRPPSAFAGPGAGIYTQPAGQLPPGVPEGAIKCPPGTSCHGVSYGEFCAGSCQAAGGAGTSVVPYAETCSLPTRGGAPMNLPVPCRGFHWNKGRYYVFGDCRRGTTAGTVERFSKLVRNRRINVANAKAAHRAVRRLVGTHHLLRSIEHAIGKIAGRVHHRGGGPRRTRAKKCSC